MEGYTREELQRAIVLLLDSLITQDQRLEVMKIQAIVLLVEQQTRIADVLEREEQYKEQQRGL